MKKKILSFLLAIFMLIPCAFALTACDKNSTPDDEPNGTMSETYWKESITPTVFSVSSYENEDINRVQIDVNGNIYKKKTETRDTGDHKEFYKTYIKRNDNTYKLATMGSDTSYKWQAELITAEQFDANYNANVTPFTELLTYLKNNFSKFTFVSNEFDGWYELVINGSEIEEKVAVVKQIMNVSTIETTRISAQNFYDGLRITLENDDNPYVINFWFNVPIFDYLYLFNSVTNYTISAGENSQTDYCVTKVTPNGFMQYYPNSSDGVGSSAICGKLITDGDNAGEYQVYARQGSAWVVSSVPQEADYYKEYTFDTYVSKFFADYTQQFNPRNTDLYIVNSNSLKFKDSYTFTCRRWTHTYKDLTITINENYEISSFTLQVSTHDSATNTDTEFIPVSISVGNTTIDFPA